MLTAVGARDLIMITTKAQAYTTCIAPQATYRSCSGAVHVTHSRRTAYRP